MTCELFVGNLPWSVKEDGLRQLFEGVVKVLAVKLITDRETGRSRGFAFVTVEESDVKKAVELDGHEIDGRKIKVNQAQPRDNNSGGGNGGGGGGGFRNNNNNFREKRGGY